MATLSLTCHGVLLRDRKSLSSPLHCRGAVGGGEQSRRQLQLGMLASRISRSSHVNLSDLFLSMEAFWVEKKSWEEDLYKLGKQEWLVGSAALMVSMKPGSAKNERHLAKSKLEDE